MPKYNLNWLISEFENGEDIDFLYFFNYPGDINNNLESNCFNQWFESPFSVNNIEYLTVGHWILAHKALLFKDKDSYDRIINSDNASDLITNGKSEIGLDQELWNDYKFEIIRIGNINKFNQNPKLVKKLIDSGNQILVVRSSIDTVFGAGFSHNDLNIENIYFWSGENCFGFLLMEVRDFFKENGIFESLENSVLPPWSVFPNFGINDMFWKMSKGEEYMVSFSKYYLSLSQKEKMIFELTNPPTIEWFGFYELEN